MSIGHPKPEPKAPKDETPSERGKRRLREKMESGLKAKDVIQALRQRHRNDIFCTEVLCGRNDAVRWDLGHKPRQKGLVEATRRMDGLSITRRWDRIVVCAFEVKVSRSDFLRDEKWSEYLPWCNRFYFATPKGLLNDDEKEKLEGQGAGLIEVQPWGGKLVARRVVKPDHRPFPGGVIPWQLYHTLLLNKAVFKGMAPDRPEV